MPLYALILIVLAASGLLFFGLAALYRLPSMASRRIKDDPNRKIRGGRLYKSVFVNMTFSSALVFVLGYLLYPFLFVEGEVPWTTTVFNTVTILLLYDFLYYLMHRFAFHQWKVLRPIHVVHHRVRHPNAVDSLYLHPIETFLGLALMLLCTWVLGPVDLITFTVVFWVYSALNIIVHCGLDIPVFGFRALSYLARKHDLHHTSMKGGNYASLTPIFDRLFGTAE